MKQIIICKCCECKEKVIGCYVSNRLPVKMECGKGGCESLSYDEAYCPQSTSGDSHGLCQQCYENALYNLKQRRKK